MFGFGVDQVVRLGLNAVMAAILFPEAFGLMALMLASLGIMMMLTDFGIAPAIIQSERADERGFLNTAWTIQVIRGVLLYGLLALSAQPLADFYGEPQLALMLYVGGLGLILNGFLPTAMATAQRRLNLRSLVLIGLTNMISAAVVTVLLGLWLQSVWALVLGNLFRAVMRLGMFWALLPGARDRFGWDPTAWTEIFRFGRWIFIGSVAALLVNQGDKLILGKYLTAEELGLYSIGFAFCGLLATVSGRVAQLVIFPVARERDPASSPLAFAQIRKAQALNALGITLLGMFLMVVGPWLIDVLYDDRYTVSRAIAVVGVAGQLPTLAIRVMPRLSAARGLSRDATYVGVVGAVLQTGMMILALETLGVEAAMLSPIVAWLATVPVLRQVARKAGYWDPALVAVVLVAQLAVIAAGMAFFSDTLALLEGFGP